MKEINSLIDKVSQVVSEPTSHLFVEILSVPSRLLKTHIACIKRIVKNRDQQAALEAKIRRQVSEIVEEAIRGIHLMTSCTMLLMLHGFFEHNVGLLRYPDEKWTPLSINDNIVIVHLARQIIDFFDNTALLQTMREFLEGKFRTERACKIYESLKSIMLSCS